MFSHIFKLIWKKKTSNFLMMLEIFFSFLVLFAVSSLSAYFYHNYKDASGMEIDHVWVANISYNNDTLPNYEGILQRLATYPKIESYAFASHNVPFSFSQSNTDFKYGNASAVSDVMRVEPDYPKTLGITLSEGRWFTWEDTIGGQYTPIVITRALKNAVFGDENPIGKSWSNTNEDGSSQGFKVLGIIDHFKHSDDFQKQGNCFFRPQGPKYDRDVLLIKVKPDADAMLEARLAKDLVNIGKDWSVEIQHMGNMKVNKNRIVWIPMLIALIVCGFLVVNVALGLFGVLFQTISRRKGEIGLRRAMGATKREILWHFVGETAMIATLGLLLGMFFAVQFPLLQVFDVQTGIYLTGMGIALAAVYGLVLLCAWYPSRQAAQIFPAEALREE